MAVGVLMAWDYKVARLSDGAREGRGGDSVTYVRASSYTDASVVSGLLPSHGAGAMRAAGVGDLRGAASLANICSAMVRRGVVVGRKMAVRACRRAAAGVDLR